MEAFEDGGFWHSGRPYDVLPQSLWVEFPNRIRVVKYSLTSRTDQRKYVATDGPSKYIFWASNSNDCQDVSSWVILKEDNTGVAFKSSNDPKIVVIENKYFYRCYGFKVNDVPGRHGIKPVTIGNVHLYSDIELHDVSLTSYGGVAQASSSHWSGNYQPMEAFEDGGFWHSDVPYDVLPQSLWVEFAEPIRIVRYSFTSRTDQIQYIATDGPSKYIFWASNSKDCQDVSKWVILKDDDMGVAFKSSNDPKIVVIENNYVYRCYGFKVNDVPGRDGIKPVTIGNVNFYSYLECTDGVIISNQCLKFRTEKLSWDNAREKCLSQNARLASLTDPEAFHDYARNTYELQDVCLTALGGVARASSSHETGNYEPMYAFEDGGFWHSGRPYDVLPQSLWVEFPEPIIVVKYSFTSRTDQMQYIATDGPSKYTFWASNSNDCQDVSNWVILKEDNTGVAFTSSNDPKIGVLENNDSYRCYGFRVNDVPGRHGIKPVTIGNINLYLKPGGNSGEKFWLGGSDSTNEGEFFWLNEQALGNQFPWPSNQPDNGGSGSDEDCLMWGYKGTYNDARCYRSLGFVCEI